MHKKVYMSTLVKIKICGKKIALPKRVCSSVEGGCSVIGHYPAKTPYDFKSLNIGE
jgi:hypothetical protein